MILETERLILRKMTHDDLPSLCKILQDPEVMYAYEHAFDNTEVQQWLDRQLERYDTDGFGLWAAVLKRTGEMIGQCGLTMQDYNGERVVEVGYLFQKEYWSKGYAIETASACKNYAFDVLGVNKVYSIIRDSNFASQNVAIRNGMTEVDRIVKHYYDMDMPHLVFVAEKE